MYSSPPSGLNSKFNDLTNAAGYKINLIDQSLTFYEIPVSIGYAIKYKKWSLMPELGVVFQKLSDTKTLVFENTNGKVNNSETNDAANVRFQSNQIIYTGAVLVQYNLFKNLAIYAGPHLRLHTGSYFKSEFTETNPALYFGLQSGIRVGF